MAEDDRDDGVGYGKPPKSGQFKPGQSGNPAGRPSKKKPRVGHAYTGGLTPNDLMMLEEAERLVRVREGERLFELPQAQAAMRSAYAKAIKGSPMALRIMIAENQRVQALEMRRRQEIWDGWRSYVDEWRRAAARAEALGQPAPTALPHPEDVEFAPDLRVYVRGPSNAEELIRAQTIADFRDLLLAMQAYADDLQPSVDESDQDIGRWIYCALGYNASLPPSLRLTGEELVARFGGLLMFRRRRLEDHITGLCSRVGWTFKAAQLLARGRRTIDMRLLGLKRVGNEIVKMPRLSHAQWRERMWADVPFEHLTTEKLDLAERLGLAGPPKWMAKARAAIAAREAAQPRSARL